MGARFASDPEYWHHRADSVQELADGMTHDADAQRIIREIAEGYRRLARHAEENLRTAVVPSHREPGQVAQQQQHRLPLPRRKLHG